MLARRSAAVGCRPCAAAKLSSHRSISILSRSYVYDCCTAGAAAGAVTAAGTGAIHEMRRPPGEATATGAGGSGSCGKGVCTGSEGRLNGEAPWALRVATSNSYLVSGRARGRARARMMG